MYLVAHVNFLLNEYDDDDDDDDDDVGLDGLACEHLKYSHPIIVTILCKLFNLFLANSRVPESFGKSYTVHI